MVSSLIPALVQRLSTPVNHYCGKLFPATALMLGLAQQVTTSKIPLSAPTPVAAILLELSISSSAPMLERTTPQGRKIPLSVPTSVVLTLVDQTIASLDIPPVFSTPDSIIRSSAVKLA